MDEPLRDAGRRARREDAPTDRVALWQARLRAGELDPACGRWISALASGRLTLSELRLRATLGDADACALVSEDLAEMLARAGLERALDLVLGTSAPDVETVADWIAGLGVSGGHAWGLLGLHAATEAVLVAAARMREVTEGRYEVGYAQAELRAGRESLAELERWLARGEVVTADEVMRWRAHVDLGRAADGVLHEAAWAHVYSDVRTRAYGILARDGDEPVPLAPVIAHVRLSLASRLDA